MARFLARRGLQGLLTLLVASVVVFGLLRLIPGDPAVIMAGGDASPATIQATRVQFGLDRNIFVQYWSWLSALFHGHLGTSFSSRGPVSELITPAVLPT